MQITNNMSSTWCYMCTCCYMLTAATRTQDSQWAHITHMSVQAVPVVAPTALTQVMINTIYLLLLEMLCQSCTEFLAAGAVTTKRLLNNDTTPTSPSSTEHKDIQTSVYSVDVAGAMLYNIQSLCSTLQLLLHTTTDTMDYQVCCLMYSQGKCQFTFAHSQMTGHHMPMLCIGGKGSNDCNGTYENRTLSQGQWHTCLMLNLPHCLLLL